VDEAVARKQNDSLRYAVVALGDVDDDARLDLLDGIRDGLRGKKSMSMPDGWPAIREGLARSRSPAVRDQTLKLSLIFGDPRALAELRRRALAKDAPIPERAAAIEALIEKQPADLAGALQDLLAEPKLRRVALRGLAVYADASTPKRVIALYAELSPAEKQDAIAALAGRKEYAAALLDAVAAKTVPRTDVSAFVARQLHALGDDAIDRRLREVWGEIRESSAQKQAQIAKYKAMVSPSGIERGDPSAGRVLFSKMCGQCHTLYGVGAKIGPDLTGSNRANVDYLLSKIIDPSAEVSKDFRMSIVTTARGRVITGMIVEGSEARITLQTATERITLAKEDIDTVRDSPLSMMPEGQLDTLSREQVRDLFAYLTSKGQSPLPKTP
jgi:putative heme-binding domain-containing protein